MDKEEMRREARSLRARLVRTDMEERLIKNFMESPEVCADSFFVYISFASEAPTAALIEALMRKRKRVLVPRIVDGDMLAVPYTRLERGPFGLLAPAEGEDAFAEVAVTPLLAFDLKGNRLGYGGGFYDKYFLSHPDTRRVGFAYSFQEREEVPADAGDVPLDAIVTEDKYLLTGARKNGILFP